jgi:hypothetical protein
MLGTLVTIVLVLVLAAALVWFLGQLPMLDATIMQIARDVIYLCVVLYVLFAVVGLFTGRAYVPLVPIR